MFCVSPDWALLVPLTSPMTPQQTTLSPTSHGGTTGCLQGERRRRSQQVMTTKRHVKKFTCWSDTWFAERHLLPAQVTDVFNQTKLKWLAHLKLRAFVITKALIWIYASFVYLINSKTLTQSLTVAEDICPWNNLHVSMCHGCRCMKRHWPPTKDSSPDWKPVSRNLLWFRSSCRELR